MNNIDVTRNPTKGDAMTSEFIFWAEIKAETDLSQTTVWRLENEEPPRFPRRVNLAPKKIAWIRTEYIAWKTARAAARESRHMASDNRNPADDAAVARQTVRGGKSAERMSSCAET